MSRILFFLLTLLVSAVVAYFSSTIVASLTVLLSTDRLPRDFLRLVMDSNLVVTASYMCVFFLSMVIFAHLLPSLHIWFHLTRAKKRLGELPLACDKLRQTTVKKFLASLDGLDFIHEFAVIYSERLHQQPPQEVPEELLKKAKLNRAIAKKDKDGKLTIEPVRASAPAASVFSSEQLVDQRLYLWFVEALPKILLAAGGLILSVNLLSLTVFDPALNVNMTTLGDFVAQLQPGLVALVFSAFTALVIYVLVKFSVGILRQNAADLAALVDHLFHHDGWHAELRDMVDMMRDSSLSKDVEKAIQRPLNAIGKATKALADDQGAKLEEFLSRAIAAFEAEMEKNAGKQLAALTGSLEKAQKTAEKMEKSFSSTAEGFASQLTQMKEAVEREENNSEQRLTAQTEKVLESLKEEIDQNYKKYGEFIGEHMSRIEETQEVLNGALADKDSLVQGLKKTSQDLGTISEASGKLVDRFAKLSKELDSLIKDAKNKTSGSGPISSAQKDELLEALDKLKKQRASQIEDLPSL
ncbi:hypothetical protein [Emcibacter nanhaiensis]|uniref:MotA/TolQ/ExbB proton channel domain-containing protein n=1 Tax=Emcibacter nanhaiensis TaxID=1505037 RepID=A0A501PHC2_9PROT|nr:hypothetical protein [Emcibacter nanhaiensis]TPD59354.1 hypothetical protein FIV46_11205 [Emcibacter nanhaiensis]